MNNTLNKENENYLETFTNEHGETWWFDYDEHVNMGVLWGTDVDYHKFIIINGECPSLILDPSESKWLKSVWKKCAVN